MPVPNTPGTIFTLAWSPDGARLAFASRSQNGVHLYSIQLDGANLKQLTNSPLYDYAPSWSPDGRQIVFTRRDPKMYTNDLYTVNADGSGEHLLVKNGDEPSWAR